ncbi:MAG: 2-C-methyl-D-erythritol 4-phosphate cytidylyltransferase [Acidobacteriota bacterium]|nr:2-C-methyl-D-erythritol 4-phosphate cytidylyltransferase [Acidobacteriota bacterium]MDQ3169495.1 2-C-methyl-D-erythritol 4-phosphate cytidylyltransferase [Acidobacteriota bacterium]
MFVSAIIVAGGRGTRLGADRPKQLLEIHGRTMLQRSVDAFASHAEIGELVIVVPAEIASQGLAAMGIDARGKPIALATGGARRQDSVAAGFQASRAAADVVLVHDAARPFVSAMLISRVIDGASRLGAVVPARQASDTVKRAASAGARVDETIPRETVWLAQTPQGFTRRVLADAVAMGGSVEATDEAMLAERAGHAVHVVEGDETNVKITTAADLERARNACPRVGTGYDLHRLVEQRPLLLGGVAVPFDKGPLGHSDGDVVSHALCDAIFGAAAMGDIGRHFSDRDPQWKDAAGLDLLARAVAIVAAAGWRVTSADVTVVLEKPRLAPFLDAIRAALASTLGVDVSAVSVKAKTNEGVDAVGRGDAIAAHAVAVITT